MRTELRRIRKRRMRDRQVQSKLKVVKKLQEEMDAIPVPSEDPMLRFQFVDVRSIRIPSGIAASSADAHPPVQRRHVRVGKRGNRDA